MVCITLGVGTSVGCVRRGRQAQNPHTLSAFYIGIGLYGGRRGHIGLLPYN